MFEDLMETEVEAFDQRQLREPACRQGRRILSHDAPELLENALFRKVVINQTDTDVASIPSMRRPRKISLVARHMPT
jgi:hypothetical protein